jgi:hypothetical protein
VVVVVAVVKVLVVVAAKDRGLVVVVRWLKVLEDCW